eukprot:629869-Rhodomonas_salina.2
MVCCWGEKLPSPSPAAVGLPVLILLKIATVAARIASFKFAILRRGYAGMRVRGYAGTRVPRRTYRCPCRDNFNYNNCAINNWPGRGVDLPGVIVSI